MRDHEEIQKNILKLFPKEKRYIGHLTESIRNLSKRLEEFKMAEARLAGYKIRGEEQKDLDESQHDFFDKYGTFLQGLYSSLSAVILFVKEAERIKADDLGTGPRTSKFLKTCLDNKILNESDYNILDHSTIIRSLAYDHTQDGALTWLTASYLTMFEDCKPPEHLEKFAADRYVLHMYPLKPYDEYRKDIIVKFEKLYWVNAPMKAFVCPHPEEIMSGYINLLHGISENRYS